MFEDITEILLYALNNKFTLLYLNGIRFLEPRRLLFISDLTKYISIYNIHVLVLIFKVSR